MLLDIFDPKAPPKAIGIDLGTTNSIVAVARDDGVSALITCDGLLTPTFIDGSIPISVGRTGRTIPQRTRRLAGMLHHEP